MFSTFGSRSLVLVDFAAVMPLLASVILNLFQDLRLEVLLVRAGLLMVKPSIE